MMGLETGSKQTDVERDGRVDGRGRRGEVGPDRRGVKGPAVGSRDRTEDSQWETPGPKRSERTGMWPSVKDHCRNTKERCRGGTTGLLCPEISPDVRLSSLALSSGPGNSKSG